jgi:hypothetical protein
MFSTAQLLSPLAEARIQNAALPATGHSSQLEIALAGSSPGGQICFPVASNLKGDVFERIPSGMF